MIDPDNRFRDLLDMLRMRCYLVGDELRSQENRAPPARSTNRVRLLLSRILVFVCEWFDCSESLTR